ncbi:MULTISPECIES: TIGR02530 family flagellar biosynthesis protein [Pontibacillus]|uniref:TIGR02530 family flagellar biosynthesis protein n=1 Tax=Pontibacillus chungwhensis TaxID=265426 RepID=A0ABY8V2J3_9BACI|nr:MULTISPECIES: TIGR02530 family flagellar biosynthesis protein [Pontibacillus]MCD5322688.1 flagellar protein [Pontibacillus sp. HN14]WIF99964.1 TIGR02530 family flagellar biosynthesis protein [Pontibacillus chungwhensis]
MDPRIQSLHTHPLTIPSKKKASSVKEGGFQDALRQELSGIKLSKHAKQRLQERNLHISDAEWEAMANRMKEAKHKGVTDSLVLMKDKALVVSTKNNTVITAMNKKEATSQVFTNINGTIVMED